MFKELRPAISNADPAEPENTKPMSDYYDLGSYGRAITTQSPEAQLWFNRGLLWCYGYNHDESVACYRRALEFDPECAMAYWGIAYASGCNYNKPWEAFDPEDIQRSVAAGYDATQEAMSRLENVSAFEKALIGALPYRYPARVPAEDMGLWNDAFADAMRRVSAEFGDDLDVATLFGEAIMNRTPWALLGSEDGADRAGRGHGRGHRSAREERWNSMAPCKHPGLLHIYIHLMEMSPHPQRALKACDALRSSGARDAGHLHHMPTHIDVLCGHYERVVASNQAAIVADRKFLEREGPINFYSLYRCHDYHFKIYGAMFLGQYRHGHRDCRRNDLHAAGSPAAGCESPPMADWLEGFISMKQHVYIRFGKWQEIIDQPLPDNPGAVLRDHSHDALRQSSGPSPPAEMFPAAEQRSRTVSTRSDGAGTGQSLRVQQLPASISLPLRER